MTYNVALYHYVQATTLRKIQEKIGRSLLLYQNKSFIHVKSEYFLFISCTVFAVSRHKDADNHSPRFALNATKKNTSDI